MLWRGGPGGVLPAGAYGGDVSEGAAGADDELEGGVRRVAGIRLDAPTGVLGRGQEGALQGAFGPVLDGSGRFGQHAQDLAWATAVVQQAALLGFPQDGDGVDGRGLNGFNA